MKKIIKHRLRQFILLFFFIGNVGILAAQSQRVTIELKNATLKELFSIVETKCFSTVCRGSENQLTIK